MLKIFEVAGNARPCWNQQLCIQKIKN